LFLSAAGAVLSHQKISSTSGSFTGALSDGDEFGGTLAWLGDLDGNGGAGGGLVIGASFDDDGGEDRGAVWTCFLVGPEPTDASDLAPGTPLYALGAARPNPFNPRTMIPFRIGTPGWVEIDVWDAHGRLVRRLVQGRKGVGAHQALWDGLDDRGRALASGPYFYRLSVDGAPVSRAEKAILVK
jgi:hypothetical protein